MKETTRLTFECRGERDSLLLTSGDARLEVERYLQRRAHLERSRLRSWSFRCAGRPLQPVYDDLCRVPSEYLELQYTLECEPRVLFVHFDGGSVSDCLPESGVDERWMANNTRLMLPEPLCEFPFRAYDTLQPVSLSDLLRGAVTDVWVGPETAAPDSQMLCAGSHALYVFRHYDVLALISLPRPVNGEELVQATMKVLSEKHGLGSLKAVSFRDDEGRPVPLHAVLQRSGVPGAVMPHIHTLPTEALGRVYVHLDDGVNVRLGGILVLPQSTLGLVGQAWHFGWVPDRTPIEILDYHTRNPVPHGDLPLGGFVDVIIPVEPRSPPVTGWGALVRVARRWLCLPADPRGEYVPPADQV